MMILMSSCLQLPAWTASYAVSLCSQVIFSKWLALDHICTSSHSLLLPFYDGKGKYYYVKTQHLNNEQWL